MYLHRILQKKDWLVYGALCAFSLGGYVLASWYKYRPGFPLDDAWIHQTYARNLIEQGEWAFLPGHISAGSTSPGWTIILAIGYLVSIKPLVWAFFAGWLILAILAVVCGLGYRRIACFDSQWWKYAGVFIIFEWHLVWAAASGMETALAALFPVLTLAIAAQIDHEVKEEDEYHGGKWFILGFLSGISIWIRPDGISLLIIPGILLLTRRVSRYTWKEWLMTAAGFLLPFTTYLLMNILITQDIWPNTFYAKQAEYKVLREIPLIRRYLTQAVLPLIGPGVILVPGFLSYIYCSFKERAWIRIAGIIWVFSFIGLYAWRLPVTYQHGRYVIPIMPVYFLMGLAGTEWLINKFRSSSGKILSRIWVFTLIGVLTGFWWVGARTYALDVAIIESEMVTSSLWIRENTAPGAIIAAHDIGALGYFGQRDILDLAGLVSPEVVPFIRDEGQLSRYLETRGADYLMTFPGWYPELTKKGTAVFSTFGKFSPLAGGENMVVYRLEGH